MIRSIRSSLRTSTILLLVLGGCAKGGTTLDGDSNESPTAASESKDGESGKGGSDGASGTGGGGGAMQVVCGNGVIDMGEDCDGSDIAMVTCVNLGFDGGNLSCDPTTCMFETSMCTRDMRNAAGMGGS